MDGLPRSTPAAQGVDPAAVLAFVDAVEADPEVELHSLMVVRHGHVVAEGWWAPYTAQRPRLVYSVSKSVTSTALGMAVDEGLVRLDDTVISHFPELADEVTDPRSRSITLRDLASMSSGHDRDMWQDALAGDRDEPVRGFLLLPPDQAPGSVFAYNQPCTYTLAAVIQRRAGMRLSDYLSTRLFGPLGIGEVAWQSHPAGREIGFSGLFARTEDVAALGLLYLQRGRWGERRLLSESYVEQATSRRVATPLMPDPDWQQGYGFQFWLSRHGFRADGAFGQFSLVLPEHDAVVALTAGTEATQALLDHVWERLLPGLGATRVDGEAQADLEHRLSSRRMPPGGGDPRPASGQAASPLRFDVAADPAEAPSVRLTSVTVDATDTGLHVTLHEQRNALTFEAGYGGWSVSEPEDAHGAVVPVAGSAGWRDDQTLVIGVAFLETPHRMEIVCSVPTHAARATWQVAPLDGGRLSTLHRPARES
ncbi:MAG: serine hydrolase domain-containing protein [Nocardioides sp.]